MAAFSPCFCCPESSSGLTHAQLPCQKMRLKIEEIVKPLPEMGTRKAEDWVRVIVNLELSLRTFVKFTQVKIGDKFAAKSANFE
ncbi:MAG TPA: hypothetical protein V6D10_14710 [Trichocoleus sp.]|jgi:hypothetical protein